MFGTALQVVTTCSNAAKTELLKKMGADVVINYKEDRVNLALKRECPKGVDLCYESVGGDMFRNCLASMANKGRMVIIGMSSTYGSANLQVTINIARHFSLSLSLALSLSLSPSLLPSFPPSLPPSPSLFSSPLLNQIEVKLQAVFKCFELL